MSNPSFFLDSVTKYADDFAAIRALLQEEGTVAFGPVPYSSSVSRRFFSDASTTRIMVRAKEGDLFVVGYAELQRHPPISALPPECWMDWFKFHFCPTTKFHLSKSNTIFLNTFIAKKEIFEDLLHRIFLECFLRDFKIRYVVITKMPQPRHYEESALAHFSPLANSFDYTVLRKFSTILLPRAFCGHLCKYCVRLYIIKRETISEGFRFRKALPEDNDEVMDIIDFEQPEIREEFGEFFIAEELLRQQKESDTHSKFIIAEKNNDTIGFIWVNDNVNVLKLVKSYECEAFGNLVKFNRNAPYRDKVTEVKGIQKKPYFKLFNEEVVKALYADLLKQDKKTREKRRTCHRPCCKKSESPSPQCAGANRTDENLLDTMSEHYKARLDVFRKIEILNYSLLEHKYFHETFKKNLRLYYNVTDKIDEKNLVMIEPEDRSNVFAIQMLGVHPRIDKRYAYRFITTAFSAYPHRDYCIIALPQSAQPKPTLRLIMKYFMPMIPRPRAKLEDNVYIIHRSTVFGELHVHNAVKSDLPAIEDILNQSQALRDKRRSNYLNLKDPENSNLPPEEVLEYKIAQMVLKKVVKHPLSKYKFLIIRCGSSVRPLDKNIVVGFVILRTFLEIDKVHTRFLLPDIEAVPERERAEVLLLRLHPNYRWESGGIFTQIAMATGFREFYYFSSTTHEEKSLANDLVSHMQPIEPRTIMPIHNIKQCKKNYAKKSAKKKKGPPLFGGLDLLNSTYAVFFHDTSPIRYFTVEESIVIIGFNFVSRALLRTMVFNFLNSKEASCHCCLPRLRVSVISRPGVVEADYDHDFECRFCENQTDCWINFQNVSSFLRDTTQRIDLRRWVTFISAKVKFIDREKQTVTLRNGCQIYYNKLILSPALSFGLPMGMSDLKTPPNYAQVNSRFDKILLYHKIMAFIDNSDKLEDYNIIVYGIHLNTYECINFLLTHRIPPKCITLIVPHDPVDTEIHLKFNICYADKNIETILAEMVEDLGVNVKVNWVVKRWQRYHANDNISHAIFEEHPENIETILPCDLFISFFDRHINSEVYDVLTSSKISTGKNFRIMVDDKFQTSDKNIFAIGVCTQQLSTANHQYLHVSCKEIADKMMHSLHIAETEAPPLVDKFSRPVFYQAQLPMGYYITKVVQPKRYLANHLSNEYTINLTTYDGNFSRVRLNEHGIVEEITCVTKTRRELDHLQFFVGKHEELLNNLHSHWYLQEIKSFVEYFEEPWTELLMHPHYPKMCRVIRKIGNETARDIVETYPEMGHKQRQRQMEVTMRELNLTAEVERVFLKFLRRNRVDFVHPFALPEDFTSTIINE